MLEAGGWRRKAGQVAVRATAGVLLLLGAFLGGTPTGRYLARAGWEEGRILLARRPIEALVADLGVAAPVRAKLQLVLAARAFAEDSLGLPAGGAFTTYTDLGRDTLVLVLSGAEPDTLAPVTWWFPIVGRVPYKGFFDAEDARSASAALAASGRDVYLRPSPAFSTLGWFDDPLLSTTLAADSVDLVNTVIHELTHNRYYAPGGAVFNESFANFVGARGAERFFRSRGDTAGASRAAARWDDERRLAVFWRTLTGALDSAFAAHPGPPARAARLVAREQVYAAARRRLVDSLAPMLETISPRYAARVALDNAALLARRVYLHDLEGFEAAFEASGRDLRVAITRLIDEHRRAGK
ncbi:MAG: aminopeptidase [Gemmatimonadetes bacterium]|nr:aminopeptidase [Gemmatimonadota bacterium]